MEDILYEVEPSGYGCETDPTWVRGFEEDSVCPDCRRFRGVLRSTGYSVHLTKRPRQAALNWAIGPRGIYDLIRRDFCEMLLDGVKHDLRLGRVFLANGQELVGYATYIGKVPLVIRGGPKSYCRVCAVCESFIYSPATPEGVCRSSLREQGVYQSAGGGLILEKSVFLRIETRRWKGLKVNRLPVLDKALDGLTEFPTNWSMA